LSETATAPGVSRWTKKPVTVEMIRWTRDNLDQVYEFVGCENFDVLDAQDRANCDDPEATATVFDKLHSTWVLVKTGQWIVKGIKNEFYPLDDQVRQETYDPAGAVLLVDRRCGHPSCRDAKRGVYRMIGGCYNCGAKPLIGLFTVTHEAGGGDCPACGCARLHWDRLATPDEIPADFEAADGDQAVSSSWLTAAKRLQERLADAHQLIAELLYDAPPSPALAERIVRAQNLGVTGWDGDPIGASESDAIEEREAEASE
jgi:hypothetical protein